MKRYRVRPSVRLCTVQYSTQRRAAGLLLSAVQRAGGKYRSTAPGVQQQRRRSTVFGSKCGQCHVDSGGTMLDTDLFVIVDYSSMCSWEV